MRPTGTQSRSWRCSNRCFFRYFPRDTEFIQPRTPQRNAYIERFNRTVRYEWLGQYHWSSLEEVQDHATQWMWTYNHERPNMALGGITPKQRLAMAA